MGLPISERSEGLGLRVEGVDCVSLPPRALAEHTLNCTSRTSTPSPVS